MLGKCLRRSRLLLCVLLSFPVLSPAVLVAGDAPGIDVFVSVPPQRWLCQQLGDGLIGVHLLVERGQDPHGFEPAPKKIQALSQSRLLFTVGLEFERELTRRLRTSSPKLRIVDTSATVEKQSMEDPSHRHGHGEELDPHIWLSPPNLKNMAARMAAALSEEDPANGHHYMKNLEKLNTLLDTLDQEIATTLAQHKGSTFLVFHPAFGYFSSRYGLHQMAVETGGRSPTPKQLFALIRKAREENVRVIFVQPQFETKSANTVAAAIEGKVVPLDPMAENPVRNLENMALAIARSLEGRGNL